MQCNQQGKGVVPVRREIPNRDQEVKKGAAGEAAVKAAAMRQLDQCAKEIEAYVEASKMEKVIEAVSKDLDDSPKLRLRRVD